MEKDLVKRFIKKDGSQRISFYRDLYADNPRYMTDEPLHCEDWLRNFSIMNKQEREYKHSDARTLICSLLGNYGKRETIIDMLIENGKHRTDGKCIVDDALVYCRSEKRWNLMKYAMHYDYETRTNKMGWYLANSYECSKNDIDLCEILEDLCDETINELCYFKYWNDGIKMMSYSFGYYGEISFSNEVSTDSEGICWLEKDEFLEYSGCKEEYWNGKTFDEIEWLLDELKAWSDNEVYGFVVEDCIKSKVHKECTNVDKDDEDYEEEEWEESDSCWGFYGDLEKIEGFMFDSAGLNKEDFVAHEE